MPKTIEKTKFDFLKSGDKLNLELSLKAGSEIGGHFVYGHVDTVALADKIIKDGDKYVIWFKVGNEFEKYLVERGSVSVDGVSLTISETSGSRFAVSLVDYTLKHTTLSGLKIGDPANVEFDMLAKYCERIILKYEKNRI
jgi:riboflavin synthase